MYLARKRLPVLVFVFTSLAGPTAAQKIDPSHPSIVTLPLMQNTPRIDGIIEEDEWSDATRVVGFVEYGTGFLVPRTGTFWFGCDGKRVFAAVKSELPPIGELLSRVRKKDGPVWNDDAIEVWIDPHWSNPSGDRRYFQFIGNTLGTVYDIAFEPGGASSAWDGDWQFANTLADGWWCAEVSVSLESLGATADDLRHEWRVHVARDWQQPMVYSAWSIGTGGFNNRDAMTRVRWDNDAPVTHVMSLGDIHAGKVDFRVAVLNPTDKPIGVKVRLEIQPTNQPWFHEERVMTLGPRSRDIVSLQRNVEPGKYLGMVRVTSSDGERIYFSRSFGWDKKPPYPWAVVKREAKAVDFNVSYYPYHRKLRACVDFSGLTAAAAVKQATIVLTREGSPKVLAKTSLAAFKDSAGEVILETPDLQSGVYAVTLRLQGGEGVPVDPFVQKFERKVWEWEHNSIGIARKVIPPFTPMQVRGTTVDCVLRSHAMNPFGLWHQVWAATEKNRSISLPLLAGPMRFDAKADNKSVAWKTNPLRFLERSPDRVATEARFTGGPLRVKVRSQFDYDGMMQVDLDLSPAGNGEVESFDILIPLREEIASLMHVCSDGCRANYAGKVPAGDGIIWDSSKAVRYDLYGTFVPYVWLGGEERGICWFADTDRDWVTDDKAPALDLLRKDGNLILRVHLINKPTRLTRTHHIVFGLQATPVKPLPEGWRRWSFYGRYPDTQQMIILGACYYWGAASPYSDVYPRKRDFSIFQKFQEARQTGKQDWGFVEEWLKGYDDTSQMDIYRASVACAMRCMIPDVRIIPYTNARGGCAGEEGKSFAAETWFEPVRSYQDFALWYYKKMMDYGMDGIYLDNTYACANRDTIAASAYVRPDGNIQPSVGIFSMRNLIKRIAVMYRMAGKEPLTVVHMTNSYIIPALSFATIALDWEDKYGAADFQDKFSPEFVRTESIGLQAGLVPLVLGGVITQDEKEKLRLSRTEFALATLHEIKIWADGRTFGLEKAHRALFEFGYGLPDCEVFPYWEPNQPVRIEGVDAKALVLKRPRKLLILVSDFGNGGECVLHLNTQQLHALPTTATDAETGEKLSLSDGCVRFPLAKHDFRMVLAE